MGNKRVLFDVVKDGQNVAPKFVPDEEEQEPNESRRLWSKLTQAINSKDMEAATEAKSAVEDAQREMRRKMEESGQKHVPRFFLLRDGRWEPKLTVPEDPELARETVQTWIWPTTSAEVSTSPLTP
jgi:hypothetical protein